MGGGDLNMKKSWHPVLLTNQKRVWEVEKTAHEEKKKLDQLKKEIEEERQLAELQRLQEESTGKKRTEKLDWMYATPSTAEGGGALGGQRIGEKDMEEYLLGKKRVDEVLKQGDNIGAAHEQFIAVQNANNAQDIAAKIREDPLLAIKRQEQLAYQAMMNNPALRKQVKAIKEKKGESKEEKKERKRREKEKMTSLAIDCRASVLTGTILISTHAQVTVARAHRTKEQIGTPRRVMTGIDMAGTGKENVMNMSGLADRKNVIVVRVRSAIQLRHPVLRILRLHDTRRITDETIGIKVATLPATDSNLGHTQHRETPNGSRTAAPSAPDIRAQKLAQMQADAVDYSSTRLTALEERRKQDEAQLAEENRVRQQRGKVGDTKGDYVRQQEKILMGGGMDLGDVLGRRGGKGLIREDM
ncbi:hypothetical protein QFC22_001726 [Naganishia vaughanmartiniae]|uniref:Uncharacterized protein n=1 Tax=Naganishia vaughanmartiniae TaxID=1424756 RepID=A0ACC2XE44_9TREE|nr:hypothetical protein QFC22_001726 [Naganishia vaughanmartiniae]